MIDMEPEETPEIKEQNADTQLAMIALVIGMICFTLSAVTPWVMGAFDPAAAEAESVVEKTAETISWWQGILATGFAPDTMNESRLHTFWTLFVMVGSIATLALGVVAFVRREDTRMSALAIAFGFLGVFMQYMMVFTGVLLILIMLYLVLASFGVT